MCSSDPLLGLHFESGEKWSFEVGKLVAVVILIGLICEKNAVFLGGRACLLVAGGMVECIAIESVQQSLLPREHYHSWD